MTRKQLEAVDCWSTKDAVLVVDGKHAAGRQAEIRLRLIKRMEKVSDAAKQYLYVKYCRSLKTKVAEIDGGSSWSTMPSYDS
ncbi:hypothetical protein IKE82_01670 [Candidatus Saccharibacteria bacterium]|nr:hypothetical protein [Candidatus Saccharibacteria bacterium]